MSDTANPPAAADPGLLTARQRLFCQLYARGGNGRAAAEGAGYSPRSARQQASRLLTYDDIRETVAELRAEAEEQNMTARAEMMARLDFVYLRAMRRGDYNPAIRTVELQAKLSGLMPARLTMAEARLLVRAQAELAAEALAEAGVAANSATNSATDPAAGPVPDAPDPAPAAGSWEDAAMPLPPSEADDPAAAVPAPATAAPAPDADPAACGEPDPCPPDGTIAMSGERSGEISGSGGADGTAPRLGASALAPDGGETPAPWTPTPLQARAAASTLAWVAQSARSSAARSAASAASSKS